MTIPNSNPTSFETLLTHAHKTTKNRVPRAALVVPSSDKWLKAADLAVRENIVSLQMIGDEAKLRERLERLELSLDAPVIDINQPDVAAITAAQMAARGEIDMIIKGRGDTRVFLSCLLKPEAKFRGRGSVVSHIGVIKPEKYSRFLFIADSGVTPEPDLKTKLMIIGNMARLFAACDIQNPKIAIVTAVEAIYPQMKATTDGAVLAKMYDRGQIKGAIVDGPLSFDVAVDPVAAEAKGLAGSEVAGKADGMVASSIETANGVFKVLSLYGQAETGGVLIGGKVPVALVNRWDSVETRFHSILLASLVATA